MAKKKSFLFMLTSKPRAFYTGLLSIEPEILLASRTQREAGLPPLPLWNCQRGGGGCMLALLKEALMILLRRFAGRLAMAAFALSLFFLACATAFSQQMDPNLYSDMRWRMIGPFRGGRVLAVSGIPGNPSVYYFARSE